MRDPMAEGSGLLREARQAIDRLVLFRGVLDDPIGRAFVTLLDQATARGTSATAISQAYGHLFAELAGAVELGQGPLVGDAWQDHLLNAIVRDENPFSRKARHPRAPMGRALLEMAQRDLSALQVLHRLDAHALTRALSALDPDALATALVPWDDFVPLDPARPAPVLAALTQLATAEDWATLAPWLAEHYAQHGTGLFAHYRALRWAPGEGGGLVGIAWPDPVRLDDLVGYERERQPLLRNTEQFLAGYRANNVLLYGDRGTGKSSTIKALLNEYGDRGLRLIEVPRRSFDDLPAITAALRGRPERFILFIDDLTVGTGEERHLDLKVLLEGGVEQHPENVVVYVTSNRRHLMRETMTADRGAVNAQGEIHPGETVQETLSLADRFGLVVTFLAPTQDRYLAIVAALAEQRNLALDPADLQARALQWATRHNGLSGRTARQFIDDLEGDHGLTSGK